MSKKAFVVILVLSVIVTYGLAITEAMVDTAANLVGIPFKFGSYTLFGTASTNYGTLFLNLSFWFAIILIAWTVIKRFNK